MKEPMGIEKYMVMYSMIIIEIFSSSSSSSFFDIIVEIEICSTDYLVFNHHKSKGVENRFASRE
jgi:hypothetical protein